MANKSGERRRCQTQRSVGNGLEKRFRTLLLNRYLLFCCTMGSTTLRIDTSSLTDSSLALSSSYVSDALTSATAPRTRGRARTLSQAVLPSFRSSSVAGGEKSPTFASHSAAPRTQKKPQKARDESRKLLAHILGELHNRPRAPPLFDMFQTDGMEKEVKGIGAMVQSVRGAVAFKASKQEHHSSRSLSFAEAGSDEDEVTESAFSTNITFDLMDQLKNVLIISQAQGWQIFDDGSGICFQRIFYVD